MNLRSATALVAHVFHQSFSEIDGLTLEELADLEADARVLLRSIYGSR